MMMTPMMHLMMTHSLRHIKRERSMLPMEILVQQREIMAMTHRFHNLVHVTQGETAGGRNPLS
jgi:hypothetical protein